MSWNTGQINPAGFQSLKCMYYIHVIMIIKWFWLDLTWHNIKRASDDKSMSLSRVIHCSFRGTWESNMTWKFSGLVFIPFTPKFIIFTPNHCTTLSRSYVRLKRIVSRWRHQMETFSALLTLSEGNHQSPVDIRPQRPVTCSFDVFFDLRLNKRGSKKSRSWWFEAPSRSLWRHCNDHDFRSGFRFGFGINVWSPAFWTAIVTLAN